MKIYGITKNNVSIQSDEYGMRAYVNSTRGRAQLEAECPAEIVQEVYKVWGDTPTVEEPTFPVQPVNTVPTLDDRIKALEAAQLAALGV
jgi:hypothetical protein